MGRHVEVFTAAFMCGLEKIAQRVLIKQGGKMLYKMAELPLVELTSMQPSHLGLLLVPLLSS